MSDGVVRHRARDKDRDGAAAVRALAVAAVAPDVGAGGAAETREAYPALAATSRCSRRCVAGVQRVRPRRAAPPEQLPAPAGVGPRRLGRRERVRRACRRCSPTSAGRACCWRCWASRSPRAAGRPASWARRTTTSPSGRRPTAARHVLPLPVPHRPLRRRGPGRGAAPGGRGDRGGRGTAMTDRATEFHRLYGELRIRDQKAFYEARRDEYRGAHRQAIIVRNALLFAAALAGWAASSPTARSARDRDHRRGVAALAGAVTAFSALVGFPGWTSCMTTRGTTSRRRRSTGARSTRTARSRAAWSGSRRSSARSPGSGVSWRCRRSRRPTTDIRDGQPATISPLFATKCYG